MRRRSPQHFYVFDILSLDGKDLRRLPLVKRKQILRRVVLLEPAPVLYADPVYVGGFSDDAGSCTWNRGPFSSQSSARNMRPDPLGPSSSLTVSITLPPFTRPQT